MRKVIRIFLASSIQELSGERQQLENFIRTISDPLEEKHNIKLQPVLCENFDHAYSVARSQERYNEAIRSSDLCCFIFGAGLGEYTLEEFQVATAHFAATGKPKIYTYFREQLNVTPELAAFRDDLSRNYGHFYDTFTHVDTLKLRLLTALQIQELSFAELSVENGCCILDGAPVLRLDDIMEFSNNIQLPRLRQALASAEEEYQCRKAEYDRGEPVYTEYAHAVSRRKWLREQIASLQEDIFAISVQMVDDAIHGRITARQQEAYRLFKQGDYEKCVMVLNPTEMDSDYAYQLERSRSQLQGIHETYIREYRTRIEMLELMRGDEAYVRCIIECYEKLVPVALRERVELDAVLEYATFLLQHNRDAIDVLEQLEVLCRAPEVCETALYAAVVNTMSLAYQEQNLPELADAAYTQVIELYSRLARENPGRYLADLALSYNNAGVFYEERGQLTKAMELYLEAIRIQSSAVDPDELLRKELSMSCNNAGILSFRQGHPKEAEDYLLRALALREALVAEDPDTYTPELAEVYSNLGNLYHALDQNSKAEEYYLQSLELREKLADQDPEQYTPGLSNICSNLGVFYHGRMDPNRAEDYYHRALALRNMLVQDNPNRFRALQGDSFYNLGVFYMEFEQDAEPYLEQAIQVRKRLFQDDPEQFAIPLIQSYLAMQAFYQECEYRGSEKFGLQAINLLDVLLNAGDHSVREMLAEACLNTAFAYKGEEKAMPFWERAIGLREELAEEDPVGQLPLLADTYFRCAFFTNDRALMQKAVILARLQPEHPLCRAILNMQES